MSADQMDALRQRQDAEYKLSRHPWHLSTAALIERAEENIRLERSYLQMADWQLGPLPEAFRARSRASLEFWQTEKRRLEAMRDPCKAGLWDIDPRSDCPICGAEPDTDCRKVKEHV